MVGLGFFAVAVGKEGNNSFFLHTMSRRSSKGFYGVVGEFPFVVIDIFSFELSVLIC